MAEISIDLIWSEDEVVGLARKFPQSQESMNVAEDSNQAKSATARW